MTSEELKTIIKEALAEAQHDFRIDPERHYLDHEVIKTLKCLDNELSEQYAEDHKWVQAIRGSMGTVRGIFWRSILALAIIGGTAWTGGALWHAFIHNIRISK